VARVLIVMAKAPIAGFAKTRLQRETGIAPADVARLAEAFLRDTLAACAGVSGVRRIVCFTPLESSGFFVEIAGDASVVLQVDGDLGARLGAAFDEGFAQAARSVVVIGTDTPQLTPAELGSAFEALERADCVLGPAEDGGYYLIGLRRSRAELLDGIAWSTDRVLAETLERARSRAITWELLDTHFDVDGAAELDRLASLVAVDPSTCPATALVLESIARSRARGPQSS